jgi:hypothetical protein
MDVRREHLMTGNPEQRHALPHTAARYAEELAPIGDRKSPIPFRQVRGNRDRCTIQLARRKK